MRVINTVIHVKRASLVNHMLKGNFQMFPIYTKNIEKNDDNNYTLTLNFSVLNTKEQPFPIDLTVSVAGVFTFEPGTPENAIEDFLEIPAVQIIYPHLRSLVSSLTASSYIQPILLPLVDARVFQSV